MRTRVGPLPCFLCCSLLSFYLFPFVTSAALTRPTSSLECIGSEVGRQFKRSTSPATYQQNDSGNTEVKMMAASLLSMTMSSSLLLLFTLLLLHPCCANGREVETAADSHLNRRLHGAEVHRTFFCSLEDAPITQVAINETIGKVYQYQESDRNTTTPPPQTYAVKACSCYSGLLNGTSYCPADSDYCVISVAYNTYYRQITSRMEGHDPSVACFRDTHLKSFARSVFNYWTILMSAMIIFLIWSGTGRVSDFILLNYLIDMFFL